MASCEWVGHFRFYRLMNLALWSKPPTQTQKFKMLQKPILSHFHHVVHLLSQITEEETLRLALTESAKLIPYVISSRKSVKTYLKVSSVGWKFHSRFLIYDFRLEMSGIVVDWSRECAAGGFPGGSTIGDVFRWVDPWYRTQSMSDSISSSYLTDNGLCPKSTYLTLVRSLISTNAHTLPSITLMKNSASDVFCLDHATAYQHAFGYIRQLAIHLRNSMKIKAKVDRNLCFSILSWFTFIIGSIQKCI